MAKAQGIFLKGFIDGGYGTSETVKKFKTRQENYIHNAERFVPYNLSQLFGDAFKKEGVEVHYSIEDNDDTLAAHAHQDGAAILSRDNDFWRYNPLPVQILKDFYISSSGTELCFKDAKYVKVPKSKKRNIMKPLPKST